MDLGRVGVWSSELRRLEETEIVRAAQELEALGYGAIWLPGRGMTPIFDRVRALLAGTRRIVVATGIVSIWEVSPETVASEYQAITAQYPGRFLLGLGVSHGREKTYEAFVSYLDKLDSLPNAVPQSDRVLAALGPRMLRLARDRAGGSHPYNVPVSHTRQARATLGAGVLLAPEQALVLESDPRTARALARQFLDYYMSAPNYTRNFIREGFSEEDLENGGSDRLIDAIVGWGDATTLRARVDAHLEAGADHVCVQMVTGKRETLPLEQWRRLAAVMNS